MEQEWFVIKDVEKFVESTRILVFNNFGTEKNSQSFTDSIKIEIEPNERDELDRILSYKECFLMAESIFKKQVHKKTLEKRYLVSDDLYHKYVEKLNERMIGNILNGLVNKGLVEVGFDSESNDFVFWLKDNENQEKPETD